MHYEEFLESKIKYNFDHGFSVKSLNSKLFPFQEYVTSKALEKGKYAIFADCGLGKTPMQLEWANQVHKHTKKPVLIACPLAVSGQTIQEGVKFNIEVVRALENIKAPVQIVNYEQLENIDTSIYSGIVLDESSILKNFNGKTKERILQLFKHTPYKLCCTATPSPNDPMELGNHSEHLNVMSRNEMLSYYFVHDGGETQKYRLRGWSETGFWSFVSSWAVMFSHPKDLGFYQEGFDLPPLNLIEQQIKTPQRDHGKLFNDIAVSATNFNEELRNTKLERMHRTIEIVNQSNENFIIWVNHNDEGEYLRKHLDAIEVKGSDSTEYKEEMLLGFAQNKFRVLITKKKIAQFGLNYQNCHNHIHASLDFSFEALYQSIRRSYRFGQKSEVNIHLITTDTMTNVIESIKNKQKQFLEMQENMRQQIDKNKDEKVVIQVSDNKALDFTALQGDCVQRVKELKNNSIDFSVFSPPFADLYTYSDKIEDMGNSKTQEEFFTHFGFLIPELYRILKPGRLIAVHCMDLPTSKSKHGYIGMNEFPDMITRTFKQIGFIKHCEFVIWKDPLLAAVRTHALGLAHKQVVKDMSMIRCGIPDKILVFRKDGDNEIPIQLKDKRFTYYRPMHEYDKFPTDITGFTEFWGYDPKSAYSKEEQYSHHVWQRYASPVWMDIDYTDTLNFQKARDSKDEKHICPLQLPTIERLILLYSNEGETVFSPFMGIGSEGYQALKMFRKFIGIELKESYYNIALKNLNNALEEREVKTFFDVAI